MNSGFYFEQTCPIINEGIKETIDGLKEILLLGKELLPNLKFKSQPDNKRDIRTAMILSLFKEILERVDGILILLEKQSALNAFIILRSYMEICFDLRIILKNMGRKMPLYYFLEKNIEILEKDNMSGKDITLELQYIIEFIKENSELIELQNLNILKLKDITSKIGNKKWCTFGNNLIEHRTSDDKLYYKYLCQETHGENSVKDNIYNNENIFELRPLRFPIHYEIVFFLTTNYMLEIVNLLKDEFQFDKSFSNRILNTFELAKKIFDNPEKRIMRK